MLFVSILLLTAGWLLLYAGIHGGDNWKQPWKPIVDLIGTK